MNNRCRYDLIGTELFKLVVQMVCACTQNVLMETTFVLCILSRDSQTRYIALARRTECGAFTVRMPTPYSLDLPWRFVWFHTAHHLSATDISQQLCISERIVRRYIDMFEQIGEVLTIISAQMHNCIVV